MSAPRTILDPLWHEVGQHLCVGCNQRPVVDDILWKLEGRRFYHNHGTVTEPVWIETWKDCGQIEVITANTLCIYKESLNYRCAHCHNQPVLDAPDWKVTTQGWVHFHNGQDLMHGQPMYITCYHTANAAYDFQHGPPEPSRALRHPDEYRCSECGSTPIPGSANWTCSGSTWWHSHSDHMTRRLAKCILLPPLDAKSTTITTVGVEKPPLGLEPQSVWKERRCYDIMAAILRYREASKDIPATWLGELHVLLGQVIDDLPRTDA